MKKKSIHVVFNTALSNYFQIICEGNNVKMKEYLFEAKYDASEVVKKEIPVPVKKEGGVAPVAKKEGAPVVKKEGEAPVVKKEGVTPIVKKEGIASIVKKEGEAPIVKKKGDAFIEKKEGEVKEEAKKEEGEIATIKKLLPLKKGMSSTKSDKDVEPQKEPQTEKDKNTETTVAATNQETQPESKHLGWKDIQIEKEKVIDPNKGLIEKVGITKAAKLPEKLAEAKGKGKPQSKEAPSQDPKTSTTDTAPAETKGFLQRKIEEQKTTALEQAIIDTTNNLRKDKAINEKVTVEDPSMSFFNIICTNMKLIQFKSDENQSNCLTSQMFLNIKHSLYSNTNLIYNCYKNLLIEMIQGYPFTSDKFSKQNSDKQSPFAFYYLCENMNRIILNNDTKLDLTMISMKIDLFDVLVNIINQKYDYGQQANFLFVFNIMQLADLLVYYLKYLYLTHCRKMQVNDNAFKERIENITFSDKMLTEMMHNYKRNPRIFEDKIFQLSRHLYLFIKLIGDKCRNRAALMFLENGDLPFSHAKKVGDIVTNRNLVAGAGSGGKDDSAKGAKKKTETASPLEKIISGKIFTCRFFNKIMKKIELINVVEKVKETRQVIFLHDPKIYIIDNKEMKEVLSNADRTSRITKLKSVIEALPDLIEKIKYKTSHATNEKWRWLTEFNYVKVDMFNCLLTVIINILFLQLLDNSSFSSALLSRSARFLEYTLVIVNIFFLTVFLFTKYPLSVHLNKIKHFAQKSPSYYNLVNVYFFDSILFNNEISTMIIVALIALFSLFSNYEVILFSLQLLTISKFSSTMQEIIQAFGRRFSQLMAMIFFLGILTFFFANYDYYFLKDSFVIEQETGEVLNTCSSLLECFLTIFNNGVQSGGGIGDVLGDASYTAGGYYERWIHDMIFYIIVMMFLLNMINGIIITTFSQLREESNEKEEDMKNICFICDIPTYELEKSNVTLKQHFKKVHNLKTYVRYIAMLSLMNDNDMDQDQFYVYNCLKKKSLEFFPLFKKPE